MVNMDRLHNFVFKRLNSHFVILRHIRLSVSLTCVGTLLTHFFQTWYDARCGLSLQYGSSLNDLDIQGQRVTGKWEPVPVVILL